MSKISSSSRYFHRRLVKWPTIWSGSWIEFFEWASWPFFNVYCSSNLLFTLLNHHHCLSLQYSIVVTEWGLAVMISLRLTTDVRQCELKNSRKKITQLEQMNLIKNLCRSLLAALIALNTRAYNDNTDSCGNDYQYTRAVLQHLWQWMSWWVM